MACGILIVSSIYLPYPILVRASQPASAEKGWTGINETPRYNQNRSSMCLKRLFAILCVALL